MIRRTPIKKKSDKKILREEIGKIHLEYLKHLRGNFDTCEICGKKTNRLGRFHILRVGQYPKLEFIDLNVLLTGWFCCHFPHHHYGGNDPKVQHIEERIKELRGPKYRDELLLLDKIQPKQSIFYLNTLKVWAQDALAILKNKS